jgi:hypothetical protein
MEGNSARRGWPAAIASRPVRAALGAILAAPVLVVLVALPGWSEPTPSGAPTASAGTDGGGYAAPAVTTVVVPSPTPRPRRAPTPSPTPSPAPTPSPTSPPTQTIIPPVTEVLVSPPGPMAPEVPPPPSTILRNALPTLRDLFSDPRRIAVGAATAALWFLLVALPGSLLDSAIEKRSHGRMGRAMAAVAVALNRAVDQVSKRTRWSLAGPLLVALLAGTAFGFADPHLAWDERSLSTIASLFVALTLITVVASQVGALLARTWWGIDAEVRAEPVGLLAALAGVGVGRFLSLSPGLFLGLVVGVNAGEGADQVRKSKAVIARHTVVFVFAIGAWLTYSFFFAPGTSGAATEAGGAGGLTGFTSDALVATTIEGLTYLVTSLLPLPLLPGREVFLHSRRLWAGFYATFALVFAVLALPSILGEEERSAATLARQGAVMLAFTAISVIGWIRTRNRAPVPDELARV